jgi:hypothetical protein
MGNVTSSGRNSGSDLASIPMAGGGLARPAFARPKSAVPPLVPRQVASLVPPGNGFPLPHDPHANHSDSTRRKPQLSNNTKVRIHP